MTDYPVPRRLRLEAGVHDIEVLSVSPDADEGDFGWTYTIAVRYRGLEREIRASESLYAAIYEHISVGNVSLRVVVAGQGRDKRYSVEAVRA